MDLDIMAEEDMKLIMEAYQAVFEWHKENQVDENKHTKSEHAKDLVFKEACKGSKLKDKEERVTATKVQDNMAVLEGNNENPKEEQSCKTKTQKR